MTTEDIRSSDSEIPKEVPVVEAYRMVSELPSSITILKESWVIFKSRFWTFAAISFIPFLLPGIVAFAVGLYAGYADADGWRLFDIAVATIGWPILILLMLVTAVVTAILLVLSQPAMFIVAKGGLEKVGVKQAFVEAKARALSFLWVSLLAGLAIVGASFLLIIPGIIAAVFFAVAPLVVLFENEKGVDALLKSREYIRGNFWQIFRYGLVMLIVSAAIGLLISIPDMLGLKPVTDILDFFRTFLLDGFWFAYAYVIYRYLRASRPSLDYVAPAKTKRVIALSLAIFGVLIMLGIIAGTVFGIRESEKQRVAEESPAGEVVMPENASSSSDLSL